MELGGKILERYQDFEETSFQDLHSHSFSKENGFRFHLERVRHNGAVKFRHVEGRKREVNGMEQ
jgi:hypothetical protein